MFRNSKNRVKIIDIDSVKAGGKIGTYPPIMIGSVFYKGHNVVKDSSLGIFDRDILENQIEVIKNISERTNLPTILDVVCTTKQSVDNYLNYILDNWNGPIAVDPLNEESLIRCVEYCDEQGLLKKIIINSITPDTKKEILEIIRGSGIKSAIVLTTGTRALISVKGRISVARELISVAQNVGIENILIDTAVTDVGNLTMACIAGHLIRNELGYPVGCGAHNVLETSKRYISKFSRSHSLITGLICSYPIIFGGDFVLYGPINGHHVEEVYELNSFIYDCYQVLRKYEKYERIL